MTRRPALRQTGGVSRGAEARLLAEALRARFPTHIGLRDFGVASGVGHTIASRALRQRPIGAAEHLKIAHALGLDPVTLAPPAEDAPAFGAVILWVTFGAALTVARHLKGHDQRTAAREAGVSLTSVSRAEHGRPLGAGLYLRLCAYAGRHPHFWTVPEEQARAVARLGFEARKAGVGSPSGDCFTGDTP